MLAKRVRYLEALYEPTVRSVRKSPKKAVCVRVDEYLIDRKWLTKKEYNEWLDQNAYIMATSSQNEILWGTGTKIAPCTP